MSGQHAFGEGEFTIRLTVTDSSGKRSTVRWDLIVLPAPDFIAGQGTFISPPGAAGHAAARSGIARFAFMSPPAGDRQARSKALVRFDTAGMRFRSGRIDSLKTLGAQVRYRGSGSLNGEQGYRFMLAATRAGGAGSAVDRVHVRIWHRDPRTGAEIIDYDNAHGGAAPTGGTRLLVEGATGTAGFN